MVSIMMYTACRMLIPRSTLNIISPVVSSTPILLPQQLRRSYATVSKPKRPLTNYLLFRKDRMPDIHANNPDLSFQEVSKLLGSEWRNLPDHEKKVYDQRAQELKDDYNRQMEEFWAQLSEQEVEELKTAAKQKRLAKQEKMFKAELKRLEKPKRPVASYALFSSEHMVEGERATEQSKRLSEKWKNCTEEEKQPYKDRAEELRRNYYIELEAWKERMIAEGREDLLPARKTKPRKGRKKEAEEEELSWEDEEEF